MSRRTKQQKQARQRRRKERRLLQAAAPRGPQPLEILGGAPIEWAEIAAADGGEKKLKTFTMLAYSGGPMRLQNFYEEVIVDLAGMKVAKKTLPSFLNHKRDQIVGHGEVDVSPQQVKFAGVVSGAGEAAREVVDSAANQFPWQASIGALGHEFEYLGPKDTATVNGRQVRGPVIIARQSTLFEISFVPLGGDKSSSARVAAQLREGTDTMNFDAWLKAKGFDPESLSDEQKRLLQASFDAEQADDEEDEDDPPPRTKKPVKKGKKLTAAAPDDEEEDDEDDPAETTRQMIRAAAAEETKRQAAIRKVCAGRFAEIEAQAIADGWDSERTELQVLRASRGSGPSIHVTSAAPANTQVLEAALCLSQATIPSQTVLAGYGEQITNQADKYRRLGVRRTLELAASMTGVQLPMQVDTQWIRAAFSSHELVGILGAVANKALAATIAAAKPVAPRISKPASHMNFHIHTVYSLGLEGELQLVAPTGELKHLSLTEESYTRQVKTRGALLRMTREDVVNDDLGVFVDMAQRIMRKALGGREKALFTLINSTGAGASFFTAARKNYFEGAGSVLSLSALSTAVQKFREQKDASNDATMIEPKLLLVPPALEETAKALMDRAAAMIAVALGSTSSKSKEPNANVWAGEFEVVPAPYLGSTLGSNGSDTAWYLLGDPADVPAFEIAYLNGNQQPIADFFGVDSDPNTLGVTWRVYWDFGAALAEYRAGVKSKGAA